MLLGRGLVMAAVKGQVAERPVDSGLTALLFVFFVVLGVWSFRSLFRGGRR